MMNGDHRLWTTLRIGALLVLITVVTATTTQAQVMLGDTFYVSVQTKTSAHPWYGKGVPWGFALNGVEGKTLRLQRGVKYTFINVNIKSADRHYFYYTEPICKWKYPDGVVPGELWGPVIDTVWFTPRKLPLDIRAPDTLYYGCYSAEYSGGLVLIYDQIPSEVKEDDWHHEQDLASMNSTGAYPNPASSETTIWFDLSERSQVRLEVVDSRGTVVATQAEIYEEGNRRAMHVPLHDVSSGFYFYRLHCIAGDRVRMMSGQLQVVR